MQDILHYIGNRFANPTVTRVRIAPQGLRLATRYTRPVPGSSCCCCCDAYQAGARQLALLCLLYSIPSVVCYKCVSAAREETYPAGARQLSLPSLSPLLVSVQCCMMRVSVCSVTTCKTGGPLPGTAQHMCQSETLAASLQWQVHSRKYIIASSRCMLVQVCQLFLLL